MDDLRRGTWLPRHLQGGDATYLLHVIEFQERSALPHLHANTKYRVEPVTPAYIDAVITVRKPPTRKKLEEMSFEDILKYVRDLHLFPDLPPDVNPPDVNEKTPTDVYDLRGTFPTDASGSKRDPMEPLTLRELAILYSILVHELLVHTCRTGFKCRPKGHTSERCKSGYPFPVCARTAVGEKGYVEHQRGPKYRNVVQHNPRLLVKYQSHVNVQIAFTVRVLAYLYAYLTKGPDATRLRLQHRAADEAVDEIADYQTLRVCSAAEAAWRLLGHHLGRREPAVDALNFHIEGEDYIVVNDDEDVAEAARRTVSPLERYFLRPDGPLFDDVLYVEYSNMSLKTTLVAESASDLFK